MFTITDPIPPPGAVIDPDAPPAAALDAVKVFNGDAPSNFWIVTSFVIPKEHQNKDWWVVLFRNKNGEIEEGFKVLGSKQRIVYSASSARGATSDVVGSSELGWNVIFDGKRHQGTGLS